MSAGGIFIPSVPTQEYAPTLDFIINNFGSTNTNDKSYVLTDNTSSNIWINPNDDTTDSLQNKIVWGRNGVSENALNRIEQLRGNSDAENNEYNNITPDLRKGFKVYSGLLEYTRNLLNASEGAVVDITRKAFKNGNGDNLVGFNGSGLFYAPTDRTPGKRWYICCSKWYIRKNRCSSA